MVLAHDASSIKRTADVVTDGQVTFDTMLLAPRTLQGLLAAGFTKPSPVQLQGIPSGKCGFNLLLEAKSGTGKTAVFTVIALDMLDNQPDAQIMILAPTREIAAQITDVIRQIGSAYEDIQVEVVMGGLPLNEDIEKFAMNRKVHVIVGSPGRLRHLIEGGYINTASVRLFVLDEADKLMEKSFKPDINYIFSSLPHSKQVIMSSATYPESLKELIVKYMTKYIHICPNSTSILLGIEQRMTVVEQHANIVKQTQIRYKELIKIFKSRQFKQCLVFCNYQARVIEVCKKLNADKWPAQFLHGQQQQTERLEALKTLQEYKCRILVTTDLAARGIDASNVDMVINFEIPYEWTTYLHRIGRAGRYGSYGISISIIAEGKEEAKFKELLSSLGGPVNIKTLWTEEPINFINVNSNADCVVKETNNNKTRETVEPSIYTKILWNVINNNDDSNNTNDDEPHGLEDFNELAASYDEADGIETFGDLLTAYEQSNEQKTDTAFRVLKVNWSTVTYNAFHNLGCSDFKVNEKKIKSKDKIDTNGELPSSISVNNPEEKMLKKPCENKNRISTENGSKDIEKYCNFNNNVYLNNANLHQNNVLPDNIYEEDSFNEKYFPNSSGMKSNRNKQDRNKTRTEDAACNSQALSLTEPVELNDQMGVYPHVAWIPAEKCTIQRTANLEVTSDEDDSSSDESVCSECSSSVECSTDSSENGDTHQDRTGTRMTPQNLLCNAYFKAAVKNYDVWKKQLAARSAQIQMAVYIEEMGKLT